MIDCSIVIVNYNTNQYILNLMSSLEMFTKDCSYEVIVVDNNSPRDNPKDLLNDYPNIRLVRNNENLGFGIANNIGISHAEGRYVLLINSDTYLIEPTIDKCIEFMDSQFAHDNNLVLMGCKLLNEDGSHQSSTFVHFNLLEWIVSSNPITSRIRNKIWGIKKPVMESQLVAGVSGAFMFFRGEPLKKIKHFDPDIFMYSEETELCRSRVSKIGNIYYWTGTKIVHYGKGSSKNIDLSFLEWVSYSLMWYKRGYLHYFLYLIWSALNMVLIMAIIPIVSQQSKKQLSIQVKAYFRSIKYLFFEIPKYSNKWGARPSPLKVI